MFRLTYTQHERMYSLDSTRVMLEFDYTKVKHKVTGETVFAIDRHISFNLRRFSFARRLTKLPDLHEFTQC